MYPASMKKITFLSATLALLLLAPFHAHAEVDFSKDVLPILSNNCFQCHGPDAAQRAAELRLDVEEGAFVNYHQASLQLLKESQIIVLCFIGLQKKILNCGCPRRFRQVVD